MSRDGPRLAIELGVSDLRLPITFVHKIERHRRRLVLSPVAEAVHEVRQRGIGMSNHVVPIHDDGISRFQSLPRHSPLSSADGSTRS